MKNQVLVNRADCPDIPADLASGWLIVNAPRPLAGEQTWTGPFRHGIFYAAGPDPAAVTDPFEQGIAERRAALWQADDAWRVVFTTNAEIEKVVLAKFAEYGYNSAAEAEAGAGVTVAEQAQVMGLPWREEQLTENQA